MLWSKTNLLTALFTLSQSRSPHIPAHTSFGDGPGNVSLGELQELGYLRTFLFLQPRLRKELSSYTFYDQGMEKTRAHKTIL